MQVTCNNLGGWTRFVFCMFPENQDNFTLNSKSMVAIILLGRVTFRQHFNLPLLQDLPKWPPPYLSIPKGVPIWLLFPQIVFYKWPDNSLSNKWLDDFFFHQTIRWFFFQQKTWSSSLDLFSFLRRSAVLLSPGPRGFCTSSSNNWEKSIYVGNANKNKTRGGVGYMKILEAPLSGMPRSSF